MPPSPFAFERIQTSFLLLQASLPPNTISRLLVAESPASPPNTIIEFVVGSYAVAGTIRAPGGPPVGWSWVQAGLPGCAYASWLSPKRTTIAARRTTAILLLRIGLPLKRLTMAEDCSPLQGDGRMRVRPPRGLLRWAGYNPRLRHKGNSSYRSGEPLFDGVRRSPPALRLCRRPGALTQNEPLHLSRRGQRQFVDKLDAPGIGV